MADEESFQKIYAFCLRKLTTRDYTQMELTRVLKRKEFEEDDITRVLERLKGLGYLNETRIAKALSQQVQRRGKGPAYLQAKLMAKGLGSFSRSARALYNADDPEQEKASVREVLAKLRARDPDASTQSLAQKLQRRGFGFDVIWDALKTKVES